jgi:hypothetical protein
MDNLVSPRKQLYPRRSRLTAVALAIVACAVVALVAVRRGQQPSTVLASEATVTGDTMFEHAGDDGDGSSLADAAIAFGDKKSLLVEDHREIKSLKSEVKTLEGEVDMLYSKLNKRGNGHIQVNVAVGAPGRPGDIGPMGPVRTCLPLLHQLCLLTRCCRWDRRVSQGSFACACVASASLTPPFSIPGIVGPRGFTGERGASSLTSSLAPARALRLTTAPFNQATTESLEQQGQRATKVTKVSRARPVPADSEVCASACSPHLPKKIELQQGFLAPWVQKATMAPAASTACGGL